MTAVVIGMSRWRSSTARSRCACARSLQLLRGQRQRRKPQSARVSCAACMAQMVVSAQSKGVHPMGAISRSTVRLSAPQAPGLRADLGLTHRETSPRRSRMVEISKSGSGEGPRWVTASGYSTGVADQRFNGSKQLCAFSLPVSQRGLLIRTSSTHGHVVDPNVLIYHRVRIGWRTAWPGCWSAAKRRSV